MQCRVCGSDRTNELCTLEYYSGYTCKIYDCHACFCRFTEHDDTIHNWLHTHPESFYGMYYEWAAKTRQLFASKDVVGLRNELTKVSKYRFVIESVEQQSGISRLLEVGCSRGHLASYFILKGYEIVAMDVSVEAITKACEFFGDHFVLSGSSVIQDRSPYDLIYHVGTIGCVADPLDVTRSLLSMLRPGGRLIFNAPNVEYCRLSGQLWSAPPPDLVTLFQPGFWRKKFSDVADVIEEVENCLPDQAFRIFVRNLFRRRTQKQISTAHGLNLEGPQAEQNNGSSASGELWSNIEKIFLKTEKIGKLLKIAPSVPSPYGLFVSMTKEDTAVTFSTSN